MTTKKSSRYNFFNPFFHKIQWLPKFFEKILAPFSQKIRVTFVQGIIGSSKM
jgi:hypothetical protein